MIRMCDTGRGICPHSPQCDHYCQFTAAELEPGPDGKCTLCVDGCPACDARKQPQVRRVKPYPSIPDDIEPVPETWQMIGSVLVGFVLVALVVIAALFFFTGLYIWSLLI